MHIPNEVLKGSKTGTKRKHMSVRQRLKLAIEVNKHCHEMLGTANRAQAAKEAELQAARYAAHQYRRRWIWTTVALTSVGLAVALAVVVG